MFTCFVCFNPYNSSVGRWGQKLSPFANKEIGVCSCTFKWIFDKQADLGSTFLWAQLWVFPLFHTAFLTFLIIPWLFDFTIWWDNTSENPKPVGRLCSYTTQILTEIFEETHPWFTNSHINAQMFPLANHALFLIILKPEVSSMSSILLHGQGNRKLLKNLQRGSIFKRKSYERKQIFKQRSKTFTWQWKILNTPIFFFFFFCFFLVYRM